MAWKATGQPTVRKQRDKWVVRVDGIDTATGKHRPRQLGTYASQRSANAAARSVQTEDRSTYVAVTRGQVENLVLVVTDSHDVADAVDVLEGVLASDRADRPATRVRRDLATTTPAAPLTPTAPVVQPRCAVPAWYEQVLDVMHAEFTYALEQVRAERREEACVDRRIDELDALLEEIKPACQPHDRAIAAARRELDEASAHRRQLERTIAEGGWRERRSARRDLPAAERDVTAAEHHVDRVAELARPVMEQRSTQRRTTRTRSRRQGAPGLATRCSRRQRGVLRLDDFDQLVHGRLRVFLTKAIDAIRDPEPEPETPT